MTCISKVLSHHLPTIQATCSVSIAASFCSWSHADILTASSARRKHGTLHCWVPLLHRRAMGRRLVLLLLADSTLLCPSCHGLQQAPSIEVLQLLLGMSQLLLLLVA